VKYSRPAGFPAAQMFDLTSRPVEILLFLVVVPLVVGPLLARWVGRWAKRAGSSPAVVRGLRSLVTIGWVAVVAYGLTLDYGPIPFLSTLTATALVGIAATLALQTTLQNIVAGFLLGRRGFLRVHDQVQFGGISGTISSLGFVTTVVRLDDGTLAFVSNSNLLSGPLINRTATHRLEGEY
jgi:small conductance mechanosensitive channel